MVDEKEEKGATAKGDAAEKPVKDDKPEKAPAKTAPETKAASDGEKPAVKAAAAEAAGPAEKPAKAEKAPAEKDSAEKASKESKVQTEAGVAPAAAEATGPAERPARVEKAPAEKAPAEKASKEPKVQTEAGVAAAPARTGGRRKDKKNIPFAIANIHATFNNTVITISDQAGNVLSWSSAGCVGFKGSRKGTPFAAQLAAQTAGNAAKEHGVRQVEVRVKGPGSGRESSIRAMQAIGLEIKSIKDVTPIPHNGCRPPKRRRV